MKLIIYIDDGGRPKLCIYCIILKEKMDINVVKMG